MTLEKIDKDLEKVQQKIDKLTEPLQKLQEQMKQLQVQKKSLEKDRKGMAEDLAMENLVSYINGNNWTTAQVLKYLEKTKMEVGHIEKETL